MSSTTTMDLSLFTPTTQIPNHQLPIFSKPILSPKITFSVPRKIKLLTVTTTAMKKPLIEGVSHELNSIASQNLDQAPARRRVRLAFTQVQQQLDHCLFKLAPSGIRTEEWYERNSKGLEIFCKKWIPEESVAVKGALFFCHGYGDTCTFFFEGIARHIAAAGYAVYAMDHPGFGLSEGLHGYIHSFDELADNVTDIYRKIKQRPELKGLPHFILGQSMGGAVTLKVHLKVPNEWDGVILVAPMCKIAEDMKPPLPILKILTLMSRVMPKAKLIPAKDLAELAFRDERKREMAVYNVICYSDRTRLRTAVELLDATSEIERRLEEVSSPLLILHGAKDRVTDPQVSQFLYEKASSKDKTLKLYEEGYHCILEGEPDERILTVLKDITTWLDFRSSSKQN
ncbi:caffeoylshikimate esterase [Cannabis sativa]|uniref:caffeoylshikimate esterase n=1 Tax=Cannabis sativa TaxID=3483 RepID=UPI0029CA53D3|nr:caffeoylshikimate esterase [Cannabis sativa]